MSKRLTLSDARTLLALVILLIATLVTATIVVWTALHALPLPGYIETVAGFLIGFATHELGVARGLSASAVTAPPIPLERQVNDVAQETRA